ncbi:MAG: dockerin type I repeat-containing protein, partial [Muribaculaceae bacterium]|nr:dockerin type I repeat-containing protein [Muribaculaceae bacterium]
DANEDYSVDVLDVTTIINYIIGKNPSPFNFVNADVNGDNSVNVMDVTALINMILGN